MEIDGRRSAPHERWALVPYGLGLSIARAFARAMRCDLQASMIEAGRLTLTLTGEASHTEA